MSATEFDVAAFVYAHRGLWGGDIPENSLAAFRAAHAAGIGVELDVRLTADEIPVVFHDASLERMCGRAEWISSVSANELSQRPLPDGSAIPTLETVLDVMGDMPVLIELKVDRQAGPIAERVADVIAGRPGLIAVMSFDEPTVARLCKLVTNRPVGLLAIADNQVEGDLVAKAETARSLGCDYIAPHHSALAIVADASGGLPLVTWTVRTLEELALARKHGAAPIFEGFSPALAMSSGNTI